MMTPMMTRMTQMTRMMPALELHQGSDHDVAFRPPSLRWRSGPMAMRVSTCILEGGRSAGVTLGAKSDMD
jgi:hypothetical protein